MSIVRRLERCLEAIGSRNSDLKDMLLWALGAAAITLVFGLVLDVLEAVL